ncbi:hypothetical protein S7711_05513 [Stachybotrys chartarum IBT 7711]|uniref:G-patch domain-containing protein n=1 Tax=Stachybotrys chartarum (strain CBS 109288 / IBT 7711) TaxID=1280523 RepID=A0A084AS24_STACB|nr:hypothetical protein S7711_05513 [Stachybotrys chartarum IBT 7711]KFA53399.1 hypothetical protein S40293_03457 [Stachybotrys chartarum IBT 40293]
MHRQKHFDLGYDDEEDVPLHRKQPFGAGLKRKRVEFVPAQEPDELAVGTISSGDAMEGVMAGDLYASIVMGSASDKTAYPSHDRPGGFGKSDEEPKPSTPICYLCSLPITTSVREHQASLAHQVSVAHSHPPSALDRSRMGLRTLAAQGWNPDARIGLGREGEGMRFPITATAKEDNLGIGATQIRRDADAKAQEKPTKPLSKKERKALEKKERERAERLQREIFGRVDVERYLGSGGGGSK